ncbi:neutral zinc metallopeptidase [Microbispora sp. H13382]|uniref:neutral zinc metallopeptidase n=1 Tax=Microbispora sp. H13382 TaxID=2729112 RepID=UPI0016036049|nr:neutral zinc metallopeptidase [Microbispora sp. H13382]
MGESAALESPIYAAPRTSARCELPAIKPDHWGSMKRYLASTSACLDRVWTREFAAVRVFYSPPRRRYIRHRTRDPQCGMMPAKGAAGTYCPLTSTYYILVPGDTIGPWGAAWAAQLIAHEYGHHVQYMTNILDYADFRSEGAAKRAIDLASRRLELQAECLSGVALRAARGELPPLTQFQDLYAGRLPAQWVRDHGRLSTQRHWFEQGWRSGRPAACDTWSGPEREVN